MPTAFPTLSRAPLMNEEETLEDSTIRDPMESGAVFARPRFSRMRRTFAVNYELLTETDRDTLRTFTQTNGGWNSFTFTDNRTSTPETLTVRFSKLPTIPDDKFAGGQKRFKASFEITEV